MSDIPASTATAYHEAGHAVAALALGRPVQCVTIVATRERLGTCAFGKAPSRPSEDWLEREILIALAGLAAEARCTGVYSWDGASQDRRSIQRLALQRAGSSRQAERLERRLLAKAEHLLAQEGNWKAVERIAVELLKAGTLSGRAARHFYEEAHRAQS